MNYYLQENLSLNICFHVPKIFGAKLVITYRSSVNLFVFCQTKFTFSSFYLITGHYEECMGGGRVLPNVPKDLVIVGSEKGGMKRPLEGGKFYLIIE